MAFLDESGFLLIPNVRKTWAPIGKTPVLRHSYKRDKISVISSVTASPERRRLGLYAQFHDDNIASIEVIGFLRHLLLHLRGSVVLLWDGGKIHRSKMVQFFLGKQRRLHVYRFPAYTPELNPDEFVWTQAKRDLSNSTHETIQDLGTHLRRSIHRVQNSQKLLWSCIQHSTLPWP